MSMSRRAGRLGRDEWIHAALTALAEGGVDAIAVEPLARRLGVTKGSFYWHFTDRNELLAAALEQWAGQTPELIEKLDRIEDPRKRLRAWAERVLGLDKRQLAALHAAADEPLVAPVLRRVTERRVAYLAGILREAGVPRATAQRRARLLYAADLGLYQLGRPGPRPTKAELTALARELERAFLS